MRVTDIFKDAKLVLENGDKAIKEIRKIQFAPGEMEEIKINASELKDGEIGDLKVSIQKGGK